MADPGTEEEEEEELDHVGGVAATADVCVNVEVDVYKQNPLNYVNVNIDHVSCSQTCEGRLFLETKMPLRLHKIRY